MYFKKINIYNVQVCRNYKTDLEGTIICTTFARVNTAFAKGHGLSPIYCHSLKVSTSTGDAGDPFNIHSDLQKAFQNKPIIKASKKPKTTTKNPTKTNPKLARKGHNTV